MANTSYSNPPVNSGDVYNFLGATRDGLIKNCRFIAMFALPNVLTRTLGPRIGNRADLSATVKDLTFLCEAAEIAGRSFQTIDARYYGPSFKVPFQSVYNDLNLTFMCKNGMKEKKFFDFWHNIINPNNSYDFEYLDDYTSSITIFTLDEAGNANYKQVFGKAYPLMVLPVQTTWADDQIARLNITFTYRDYKTREDPPPLAALQQIVRDATTQLEGGSLFLGDPFLTIPAVS